MRKFKYENLIAGAVANCDPALTPDASYAQGVVVGIVSALMADGWTFSRALEGIARSWRANYDLNRVPEAWRPTLQLAFMDEQRKRGVA